MRNSSLLLPSGVVVVGVALVTAACGSSDSGSGGGPGAAGSLDTAGNAGTAGATTEGTAGGATTEGTAGAATGVRAGAGGTEGTAGASGGGESGAGGTGMGGAGVGGAGGSIVLPKQPAGLPSGKIPSNLTCVLADGFSTQGVPLGSPSSLWGRVNGGGFNPNEVETFVVGQNAVTTDGLVQTATYSHTSGGLNYYNSGQVDSCPTVPGLGGWVPTEKVKGFLFLPQAGVTTVIEWVGSIPLPTAQNLGFDFGVWSSGPKGRYEIDFPEFQFHPAGGNVASDWQGSYWNILNHVSNVASATELDGYNTTANPPYLTDGKPHTYAALLNGVTSMAVYVDKAYQGTVGWTPGTDPVEPMGLIISYGIRNYGSKFTGSQTVTVRSIQVWSDHPAQGAWTGSGEAMTLTGGSFYGGGIAKGTVLQ